MRSQFLQQKVNLKETDVRSHAHQASCMYVVRHTISYYYWWHFMTIQQLYKKNGMYLVYIFHVHVCYGYLIKLYATFSGQLSDGIANARISSYENVATTINEVSNCGNFDCTTKILNDREYTYNQLTSNAFSDFNYLYITINNSGGPTILLPTNFEFSW